MWKDKRTKLGFKRIVEGLKSDIESGVLEYGYPLAPSRLLAEQLGVSRDTVVNAYRELESLRYIDSDGRRGTFVVYQARAQTSPELSVPAPAEYRLSQTGHVLAASVADAGSQGSADEYAAFNYGAVPREALPLRQWRELLRLSAQAIKISNLEYAPDVFGRAEFRQTLAKFLSHSKGIKCRKDDIAVFNISLTAVGILFDLLLESGDCIAVEDPGYPVVQQLAKKHQLRLVTLPVDDKGAQVETLSALQPKPRLIYLTPDSHDPTGATLSMERRLELLVWANNNDAWIIEDGFDTHFRYGEAAPPALKSLDTGGRVFYLSTFWQLLYPLATTSYLIMPPGFADFIRCAKALTDGIAETMPQVILAELLESGYMSGHIRRWNKVFAARRRAIIHRMTQSFGKDMRIPPYSAGLHCLIELKNFSTANVLSAASAAKLPLRSVSVRGANGNSQLYVCYFAGLDETSAERVVKTFAENLK